VDKVPVVVAPLLESSEVPGIKSGPTTALFVKSAVAVKVVIAEAAANWVFLT